MEMPESELAPAELGKLDPEGIVWPDWLVAT